MKRLIIPLLKQRLLFFIIIILLTNSASPDNNPAKDYADKLLKRYNDILKYDMTPYNAKLEKVVLKALISLHDPRLKPYHKYFTKHNSINLLSSLISVNMEQKQYEKALYYANLMYYQSDKPNNKIAAIKLYYAALNNIDKEKAEDYKHQSNDLVLALIQNTDSLIDKVEGLHSLYLYYVTTKQNNKVDSIVSSMENLIEYEIPQNYNSTKKILILNSSFSILKNIKNNTKDDEKKEMLIKKMKGVAEEILKFDSDNAEMKKFLETFIIKEGSSAPNFKRKMLSGENFVLKDHLNKGNVIILDIFASW